MLHEQVRQRQPQLALVSIRALRGFTPDDVHSVSVALCVAQGWDVDQHIAYDGTVTILAAHDMTGQIFALTGTVDNVELSRFDDDRMLTCGAFESMEAALDALRRIMHQAA